MPILGEFPHGFTKYVNFKHSGGVPDDEYYLSFGQIKLNDDTIKYLDERRASGLPWDFAKEMYDYCISDVEILRQGCQIFLEKNFIFQIKLIERFAFTCLI